MASETPVNPLIEGMARAIYAFDREGHEKLARAVERISARMADNGMFYGERPTVGDDLRLPPWETTHESYRQGWYDKAKAAMAALNEALSEEIVSKRKTVRIPLMIDSFDIEYVEVERLTSWSGHVRLSVPLGRSTVYLPSSLFVANLERGLAVAEGKKG